MAVQVEILSTSPTSIRLAFYYAVPPAMQLPGAADPNRAPAGSALSPAEVQDLKDGKIFEVVKDFPVPPEMDIGVARQRIESEWLLLRSQAAEQYRRLYVNSRFVGAYWDGTSWTTI